MQSLLLQHFQHHFSTFITLVFFCTKININESLNCHKCYKMEECPLKNCSRIYDLVAKTYRENFHIPAQHQLPICPPESDEASWKKLEVDGKCGGKYSWRGKESCAMSPFQISGITLRTTVLSGVFLGCPEETFSRPVLSKYGCVYRRNYAENYRNGIKDFRYAYIDLSIILSICNVNCTDSPSRCNLCFEDGCIYPNNTIVMHRTKTQALPISMALFGLGLVIVFSLLFASFCQPEKMGRLDLVKLDSTS